MGSKRITSAFCVVLLSAAGALAADKIDSTKAATTTVSAMASSTALPSSAEAVAIEPWIHTRMNDDLRSSVEAGYEIAIQRVQEVDSCSDLFAELGADSMEALASALYWPVFSHRDAKKLCGGKNLAFTVVGSPMTFICSDFERLSDQEAAKIIIHEALHTAGGIASSRPSNLTGRFRSCVRRSCRDPFHEGF